MNNNVMIGAVRAAKIPDAIQKLIDYMIENKILVKVVKVKKGSEAHNKFMKDAKVAIEKKLLRIKHNPIDNTEMRISLGPEASNKIKF